MSPAHNALTILVVEDHEDSRSMMQTMLELDGFKVFTAETGGRALRLVREILPDVILMDLNLPDCDGLTVTRLIRRHAASRRIPIIALTAYDMNETRERALAAGCNEFMLKPVDFEKLEAVLNFFLGTENGRGSEGPSEQSRHSGHPGTPGIRVTKAHRSRHDASPQWVPRRSFNPGTTR